jgi:hypothetical protein
LRTVALDVCDGSAKQPACCWRSPRHADPEIELRLVDGWSVRRRLMNEAFCASSAERAQVRSSWSMTDPC